jgi:hypothetical protein
MGDVTGLVPNVNIMPSGAPELLRFTGEKNTPRDWTVIVEVADAPGGMDRYDGEAVIAKSATPAATVTSRSTLWVSMLLVPVTRNVKAPVDAVGPAEMIRVDATPLSGGGVMGVGSVKATPSGCAPDQEPASSTAEVKPSIEVTVHVLVPLALCTTINDDGSHSMT